MSVSPSGRYSAEIQKPFGVRIHGDLSVALAQEDRTWLAGLMDTHCLIMAEGQTLAFEQQLSLLESFGPVLERTQDLNYVDAGEGVLNCEPLAFHSDMAFARSPYLILSLHAVDVVAGESCTRFANGVLAHEKLSAAQRQKLDGLTATWISTQANRRIPHDAKGRFQHTRAPILTHPRTGRPILYVNEGQTARINGLPEAESIALLDELFALLYAPENVFQQDWKMGDIVVWDNLALQHGRPPLGAVTRRRLQRGSCAT